MTVKTIFKVLLASIVIPIVGFLLIEFYNVSTVSVEIGALANAAANQSAILFSKETYKVTEGSSGYNGLGNQRNVVSETGELFVSGKFYEGSSKEEVYNKLYTNSNFRNWVTSDVIRNKGNWNNVRYIDSKLNRGNAGLTEEEIKKATMYVNTLMTPNNMGVPYLDRDVVTRMFRWNLAELFSSGKPQNVKKDSQGRLYSSFNGYRIYANLATINSLEYRVYDLSKSADRAEFERVTSMNPTKFGGNAQMSGDDRSRVGVVGISYSVPTGYEGITPIKRAFEFMWDTEVNGIDGKSQRSQVRQEWNDALASYDSGGFDGNTALSGILPVPGRLVYYIVR